MPVTAVESGIRSIEIDGLKVRISVRGEGTPLLLIMGFGGNLDMWRPFEDAITQHGVQTIAFDMPGTGESSAWRVPRRMPGLADFTASLLETLGHESANVLGVSWGGAVAQTLAVRFPQRVHRLVLAATAPGIGGQPPRLSALMHMATPLRYWSPWYFETFAGQLYGGRARTRVRDRGVSAAGRFDSPPSLYGYMSQIYAIAGWSSLPWLHRVTQSTLVLAGDDDPLVRMGNTRMLAGLIPNAQQHVISGGGHLFLLEHADECATRISAFLEAA
jgi:poly(3-hydroxyalkanoate) depolymerase